uniref:Pre-rRNA-processing protein RIX1 N-terminal domain-containing protein n=1 Tax=Glossina pallidipes TaxID=7398 RepID=A0A1A9ZYM6_GLOPL
MNEMKSVLQTLLSTENTYLDVYLDGLCEHKIFDECDDIDQRINLLLLKSNTRTLGFQLLNQFLDYSQAAVLERRANIWIPVVLKSCSSQDSSNMILCFDLLTKFAMRCHENCDLSKMFINNYLYKVYECLSNVLEIGIESALRCIETCLRLYAAPSASFQGVIDRFLKKFIDSTDHNIIVYCGKCMHMLQQIRGGGQQGVNHKTRWQEHQNQLVASIHAIFNEMFSNCSETYEGDSSHQTGNKTITDLSSEPVQKAAQLYVRAHNIIEYLIIALKDPFPVEKSIMPKKILNLISVGTSVTCFTLQQNPIADNLVLGVLLPQLHKDLLRLLDTLILILGPHLKPHYQLIWDITLQSLKWTTVLKAQEESNGINLASLRAKAYETIALWCQTLKSGCHGETIAEFLVNEIFSDIPCMHTGMTLQVSSGARKHLSKKARRQLNKAHNEQSKLSQVNSNRKSNQYRNKNLFTSVVWALRCLQQILWTLANFLKPPTMKAIHLNITQLAIQLYDNLPTSTVIQHNSMYRLEVYNSLSVTIMAPNHLCPPPTEIALKILQFAHLSDNSLSVRNHCTHLIRNLEKLIHPQKESLLFPLEARDIRNAFVKSGQEHLLNTTPGILLATTQYNEAANNDNLVNIENQELGDDETGPSDHRNSSLSFALKAERYREGKEINDVVDNENKPFDHCGLGAECDKEGNKTNETVVEEKMDDEQTYTPNSKKRKINEDATPSNSKQSCIELNSSDADAVDQLLEDIAAEFVDELN